MNLNDYFEPVSLEKPADSIGTSAAMFGRNLRINTPSDPIDEISDYQLAIFGVNEDRNSTNTGSANAPDVIRRKLYELYRINDRIRIIDLGNLKNTSGPQDTYFGLRDVMTDLLNNQVTAIVIGGTQDLTAGLYMAFEQRFAKVNVLTIDSRIDMDPAGPGSFSWNIPVVNSPRIFRYSTIGHQQYLVDQAYVEILEEKGFDIVRLGPLRSNLIMAEPFVRDANLVSFDIGAVRQSEAPGTKFPSPNGLMSEEACQLSRFAGLSDMVSCFGVFEVNDRYDNHSQTAHLAAQSIWHFAEGFSQRKKEKPSQANSDFKVFMVNHTDMEHALTFYKSLVTGRWWMEIPEMKSGGQILVACSQDEYQQACNHDIPEMWWKAFQRIN
ncbi:MAG TPA: formimidoylglutamase [Bacteroidales bacterium]|nr:formimidoylglutamase [Bacteroidales bacterium]